MAERVLGKLAIRIAGEIGRRVVEDRRAMLAEARKHEAEGRPEAALDVYVAFVLSVGDAMPLEQRVAWNRIESRWGIRPRPDGLDVSGLRIE